MNWFANLVNPRRSGSRSNSRFGLALAAPVLALVFALVLSSIVLLIAGHPPLQTFQDMVSYGSKPPQLVAILNRACPYYIAAVAVAVGFRMNLFNIGVDGQYQLAAMVAAVVGAAIHLPSVLHVLVILLVAVLVGAAWAGVAGLLRVTRGVSEVIATIMLNFIATSLVAWMLTPQVFAKLQGNNVATPQIPGSGRVPGFDTGHGKVYGLVVLVVLVGLGYWFLLERTRFGFDLRSTGRSEPAAVASGVDVKRMVLFAMLISGGVAGLVGMPQLLGASYTYSLDFPAGLGFTGIAIALLGRNNPVGIAFAALLWSFLDQSSQILDLSGVPKEIVTIMQGTIVLAVVVAYEVVRRISVAREQAKVGEELGGADGASDEPAPAGTGVAL